MRLTPRLVALTLVLLSGCRTAPSNAPRATPKTTALPATVTFTGVVHVEGTLTTFDAPASLTEPIAAPFTITVADAGRGGFSISGAVVAGRSDTIVWSGGRPLPVTGACKLDVSEAPLHVTVSSAAFSLDGAVRALTAGPCAFGSPVAVGGGGLAEPMESEQFTLPRDATFEPTGGAGVAISPGRHYEGRHGGATAAGSFTVTDRTENTWRATRIVLRSGTWILDVTRGLHVRGQFDGDLTIDRAA